MLWSKWRIIVAIWICTSALCLAQEGTACSISQSEYNALQSLFDSLDGQHWLWDTTQPPTTHWSFPSALYDPCLESWQGLEFDLTSTGDCTVVALELPSMALVGSIPPLALGNLSNVVTLDVALNFLSGSLPSSIGQLKLLSSLLFDHTHIDGTLPDNLFALTNLKTLVFSNTHISGSVHLILTMSLTAYSSLCRHNSIWVWSSNSADVPWDVWSIDVWVHTGFDLDSFEPQYLIHWCPRHHWYKVFFV